MDAFKDSVRPKVEDGRLVYIGAADDSRDLTGITITNMFLNGAGGECVRLRNNAHDNVDLRLGHPVLRHVRQG